MSKWRNKAKANLLQYSHVKKDIERASKEWEFSGIVTDHLTSNNFCQLCEGENLRYHYEIVNNNNQHKLNVGSSCIKKFDITVYDDTNEEIFGKEKDNYLKRLIVNLQTKKAVELLRKIWKHCNIEERDYVEYCANQYKRNGKLSPNNLIQIFTLAEQYKIDLHYSLFKVSLRSKYNLLSILNTDEKNQNKLIKCLTAHQLKLYKNKKKEHEKHIQEITLKTEQNYNAKYEVMASSTNLKNAVKRYKKKNTSPKKVAKKINKLPEYVTCSLCGEYTNKWVTLNPNKCRQCLKNK